MVDIKIGVMDDLIKNDARKVIPDFFRFLTKERRHDQKAVIASILSLALKLNEVEESAMLRRVQNIIYEVHRKDRKPQLIFCKYMIKCYLLEFLVFQGIPEVSAKLTVDSIKNKELEERVNSLEQEVKALKESTQQVA